MRQEPLVQESANFLQRERWSIFLPLQTIQLLLELLSSTIVARKQPRPHVNEQALFIVLLCFNNTLPTRTGNKLDVDQGPC